MGKIKGKKDSDKRGGMGKRLKSEMKRVKSNSKQKCKSKK